MGRLDEALEIVEAIAGALPELGSNRTAVYLALADCFIARRQPHPATLDLIGHLESEADDPRYEAEVAVAIVALSHSVGACAGSCESAGAIVDKWDQKGQHFEAIKRRVLLARAAADHSLVDSTTQCREALRAVIAADQAWYLQVFVRSFSELANKFVDSGPDADVLSKFLEVDPDTWRRPVIAALITANREVRAQLLDAMGADLHPQTIEALKTVKGRDVEEARARLIRRSAERIRVKSFGSIQIRRGGTNGATVVVHRPRQRTLLGFLIARVESPPSRDQVIETIWPNAEPEDAVNSLNQSVYQLRRVIDPRYRDGESPQYLISTADTVSLDPSLVSTDLQEFRASARALERGEVVDVRALGSELLGIVDGEFLAELVYEDWATSFRMAVHAEVRPVLLRFAEDPWRSAYPDLGLRAATKVADLDPYDERAHLCMARCLQAMGRTEAARVVIRRFLARLHDDLGEAPETDFSPFTPAVAYLTDPHVVK